MFGYQRLHFWLHTATVVATKLFTRIIMQKTQTTPRTFRFSDSELEKLQALASEELVSLNTIVRRLVNKGMLEEQLSKGKFEDFLPEGKYDYSGKTISYVAVRNMFLLEKLIIGYDEDAKSILKQASKDAKNLLMWDVENS
jgi:hypothetical protein